MAGMAEEVIPGVPRSVEPLTQHLRSVHARLDLSVHHFIPSTSSQASLLPSTVSISRRLITTTGIRSRLLFLCEHAAPGWALSPSSLARAGEAECQLCAMCCTGRSETSSPLLALKSFSGYIGPKSNIEYSKTSLGNHVNPSVRYQTLALVSACSCATLENLRTGERGSPFQ